MLRRVLSLAPDQKGQARGADGKERSDAGGQWSGCEDQTYGKPDWRAEDVGERRANSVYVYRNHKVESTLNVKIALSFVVEAQLVPNTTEKSGVS